MAQPTQEEVDRVIAAYENAQKAIAYAGTIAAEMQQIEGDDYEMVWSSAFQE